MFNMLFTVANAEGNISIEEIGAESAELVEGMRIPLFAALSNTGDSQVVINLEFRLGSNNVSRHEGIVLQSGTQQKRIVSDYASISPGNMTIEVIAYSGDQEVARKSGQITVHKRQDIIEEDEQDVVLLILAAFGILFSFIIIKVFLNRRRAKRIRIDEEREPETHASMSMEHDPMMDGRSLEITNRFSDEIMSFSREMEKQGKESKKEEERGNISSFLKSPQNTSASHLQSPLNAELDELRIEVNRKKQFVDTLIPDLLLQLAEEKLHEGDLEGAMSIIFSARKLINNEEVIQRLRKLREIGY